MLKLNIFQRINQTLSKLDRTVSKTEHDRNMQTKLDYITPQITQLAREFLLLNYVNSGIGTKQNDDYKQTGLLRNAISKSNVRLFMKNGMLKIKVMMPPGMPNFKNGSNFYTVAQSLHSGYVTGATNASKNQRKYYKNFMKGEKLTKGQYRSMVSAAEENLDMKIIAPKPYFYLTPTQLLEIKDRVNRLISSGQK